MQNTIKHTADWRLSTVASWLAVTIACVFYTPSTLTILLQLPVHFLILFLLLAIIRKPNDNVALYASGYFLLITCLFPLTNTSLVLIHMAMFSSLFSAHFKPATLIGCILALLATYGGILQFYTHETIPWVTLAIWGVFAIFNGILSRRFVESLNMHYQSRQNYKELKATQNMMKAMSAEQERLALSRELHDSLGHKLTALSINLDFLKRKAPQEMTETVNQCHALSQEILAEVRQIVSAQRNDFGLIKTTLTDLFRSTPSLKCTLEISPNLEPLPQHIGLCVIRFCQEMISNTLKHTNASAIDIVLSRDETEKDAPIVVTAMHNARESVLPKLGNGLKGMNERVAMLDGEFTQRLLNNALISELKIPFNRSTPEVA
ncbi:histidine kinase [Pseudoalteromonas xiamenensis]|uniref:sensor histidine kinase n=1 Tax=Pseudoalteromonas xiamenensis TaxID=882626 RepID=UPI0027E4AAE1|nr:histidine kinase [Pseudoalteromonas xiamenensis]WMN60608.1 histidine kinase [Pseudoalteromonas xiamenensis]